MSGWSNLSNELFRMSHNANQTIWASGAGRRSYGGALQGKPVFVKSGKPKNNKKFHNGIPEGLENDAERADLEALAVEETEKKDYGTETEEIWMSEGSDPVRKTAKKKNSKKKKEKRTVSDEKVDISEDAGKNLKSGRLEQQTAQMRAHNEEAAISVQEASGAYRFQIKDPATLQDAVLWAEILGEPVSVKRRKKRTSQYYGD